MKKNRIKFFFFEAIFSFLTFCLFPQQKIIEVTQNFPVISKLNTTDIIFKQMQEAINYNEKIISSDSKDELIFEIYEYKPEKYDDLLSIHAATGIPYDTIATLNSISYSKEKIQNRTLLLPTVKGIFIADSPENNFEILISEEFAKKLGNNQINCYNIRGRNLFFCLGDRLSPTQRAFFLDTSFRLPLDKIIVSSDFGYRKSPVYNRWKFHAGIDLAAEEGQPVYACKSGRVSFVMKQDQIFGNCIVLQHDNGLSSVYAHLSETCVKDNDYVSKGKIIGKTGRTGLVTGPHLHFEIRHNGKATDPADFFREYR